MPVLDALRAILDAAPADKLTFLMTHQHKPYMARGLSNRMRDRCDDRRRERCNRASAHGGLWLDIVQADRKIHSPGRPKEDGRAAMALIKVG